MNEPLILNAQLRETKTGRLFPEQSAAFDLTLRNDGPQPRAVLSLVGNQWTPTVRAHGADGAVLVEANPVEASNRVAGELGEPQPAPPRLRNLPPRQAQQTWINLWNFVDPLPTGRYQFSAVHRLDPKAPGAVTSAPVPFEIIPALVQDAACGYEGMPRMASVLAWLATPIDRKQPPELLLRLSAFGNHAVAQQGGTAHGPVPPGSRLSVSQTAPGERGWTGWVAVLAGTEVTLIRHNMTHSTWRSAPIPLPGSELSPVPRFPDRTRAVYLATGRLGSAGVVTGFALRPGDTQVLPWQVPLPVPPTRAVCAFEAKGAIALLLALEDGRSTRLLRLDVDPDGTVQSPEREVRTTPNIILGLTADMRPGVPPGFLALEADRAKPDQVALVRLPIAGPPTASATAPLAGWPATGQGESRRLLRAAATALEVALDGSTWLAIVDEQGSLHGGRVDQALTPVHAGPGQRALWPHIAALRGGHSVSAFDSAGRLIHSGGHKAH
jgi:hypothetical protein